MSKICEYLYGGHLLFFVLEFYPLPGIPSPLIHYVIPPSYPDTWSMVLYLLFHWSLVPGCRSRGLVPGPWSLVPGPWSLVPGPWSLAMPINLLKRYFDTKGRKVDGASFVHGCLLALPSSVFNSL